MANELALCVLTIMAVVLLAINSTQLSSETFTFRPILNGNICKEKVQLFTHSGLKLFHCINICFRRNGNACVGVFYKESQQECFGCSRMDTTDLVPLSGTISLHSCSYDLVQNAIDSQLSESTTFYGDGITSAFSARLDTETTVGLPGCWSPHPDDVDPYIQVDFLDQMLVTAVVTQGRDSTGIQWVTEYRVLTSADCSNWEYVVDLDGVTKLFAGNTDMVTHVTNVLVPPVNARCVRVNPTQYNNYPSMRFGVLGCP